MGRGGLRIPASPYLSTALLVPWADPRSHEPTICPFDHYSDGTSTEPPRTPAPHPGPPPPHVHEPTICPFDHYSDGTSTEPPRTPAPHPGPPPRSTNPLFVHLTIIETEHPRNPRGSTPRAPPPHVHEPTICPFDHYSDGTSTEPPRTHTPGPPPRSHEPTICPFDHYSDGTSTEPPRTPAPHPGPPPPPPMSTNPLFVQISTIFTELVQKWPEGWDGRPPPTDARRRPLWPFCEL